MILLPAIDLKDGRCVRLKQGEFDTVHQVADSALETARAFAAAGARWVHMVDLDGARDGMRKNADLVRQVVRESGLKVELGGGIKTEADVDAVLELGAARLVIGSAAVTNPAVVDYAVARAGEAVAVGIDCLEGRVRTAGWEQDSGLDYLDFARQMEARGVRTLIFTDISTDGMLTGPSYDQLAALQKAVGCQIVASGGVSSNADLVRLRDMGLYGAIVGKAYYTGAVDLKRAVEEVGEP